MGPTGTADTICHVNSHSLHGIFFFLEGNYHAQATLGVLAASKPSLQPAKPTQQQRRCSGLNVLSQASFPPGLLACCYLSSLVLGVFSSGSSAQAQGASTFPMDLGARAEPRDRWHHVPSRTWVSAQRAPRGCRISAAWGYLQDQALNLESGSNLIGCVAVTLRRPCCSDGVCGWV